MAFSFSGSTRRVAFAALTVLGGASLLTACGGGGGGGGVDRPSIGSNLGTLPTVSKLQAPLGVVGFRGSGSTTVFIAYVLKDQEYNSVDVQIEYGWDVNGDDIITPSDSDPTDTDEFFACTPVPGVGDPTTGLDSAGGKGASHIFAWDSGADMPGERVVAQDYEHSPQGRVLLGPGGVPLFLNTPGMKMRMRANDGSGYTSYGKRWGPWQTTTSFDLNNNSAPYATIDAVGISGVTPNATLSAADEDVTLSFHLFDEDLDPLAVYVDYSPVSQSLAFAASAISTAADTITSPAHGLASGTQALIFKTSGTLPAGVTLGEVVYVLNATANTFQLTTSVGGFAINFGDQGTGTHTLLISPQWYPASAYPGTVDTGLASALARDGGAPHTFAWDSAKDVGTVNGEYTLRITAYDTESEVGPSTTMTGSFTLDNHTIFTSAGSALAAARVGHRAVTLADDRVLIAGGSTSVAGAPVNTSQVFIPGIGQTTSGPTITAGALGTARSFHTMTRLYDDKVLAAGGFGSSGSSGVLSSLEIFDPAGSAWSAAAPMAVGRARHTAVLMASGDVLLAGGVDGSGIALSSAYVYHADTGLVTATDVLNVARYDAEGVLLPDGKVLIAGGRATGGAALSTVEIFDPRAAAGVGDFSAGTDMGSARAAFSMCNLVNGKVLVAGGVDASGTALSSVEAYEPNPAVVNGLAWTAGTSMSTARQGHVGVLMNDGQVLFAGGTNGSVLATATLYDPAGGSYGATNGGLATARREAASTLLNNGRVLVTGGLDASGNALSSMEIFTPGNAFDRLPTVIFDPATEDQSWAYGGLFKCRLIDPESDNARLVFQYSISGGAWKDCTSRNGPWSDGVGNDTLRNDSNHGVVDLTSVAADSALAIDPVTPATVGDHLFVWDIPSDITVKADYSVRVRAVPYAGTRAAAGATTGFQVIADTKPLPSFYAFASPVSGDISINYHLLDLDGDGCRVAFDFALDVDGDGQILASSGESWSPCHEAPGDDGLGAGHTLSSSTTRVDPPPGAGWHVFGWDSVRDIGSPDVAQTWSDYIVRISTFDQPAGYLSENTGFTEYLASSPGGLNIVIDPNALLLTSWGTAGAGQNPGTATQTYAGAGTVTGVKLDEILVFTFSKPIDARTVSTTTTTNPGLSTLQVFVGNNQILGGYSIEPTDHKKVYFYPLIAGILNGVLYPNGTESQTVLTRGATARVVVPAYTAGEDPQTATCLKVENYDAQVTAVNIVNAVTRAYDPGFGVIGTAGAGAYVTRGVAPALTAIVPANNAPNQGTAQAVQMTFDFPLAGETISPANLKIVVDINGNGIADPNDSVIPGTLEVTNRMGPSGVRESVVIFTPFLTVPYPSGMQILVDASGVKAADGTLVNPTGTKSTFMVSAGGGPVARTFAETFASTTNRDAANTTALWNSATYPGVLTGMRAGGSASDGVPTVNSGTNGGGGLWTFSTKDIWNFESFTLPAGQTWRFTGGASRLPAQIFVANNVDIAGTLDVSGADGTTNDSTNTTYQSPWYAYYASDLYSATSGGTGGPGGGNGAGAAAHTTFSYSCFSGSAGSPASGFSTGGGGGGLVYSTSYYYYMQPGGGGGGHAQAGQAGGKYGSSTVYGTAGAGGAAYGSDTFSLTSGNAEGGAGGGSGASDTYYSYYYRAGCGGGGGGAVTMTCNGSLTVRGTGYINAKGGDGGNCYADPYFGYGSGGGGGGAGGGIALRSGGTMTVKGMLDVRGGLGGIPCYGPGTYLNTNGKYGTQGGDGASGRVRLESPNLTTNTVGVVGGLAVTPPPGGVAPTGGVGTLGAFTASAGTTNINFSTLTLDGAGFANYTSYTVPAGSTVNYTSSTNIPVKIRCTGNCTINGVVTVNGAIGSSGSTVYYNGSYPTMSGGGVPGPGGFSGGVPNSSVTSTVSNGLSGNQGAAGGGGGGGTAALTKQYAGYYTYNFAGGGGGGATNLRSGAGATAGLKSLFGTTFLSPGAGGLKGTSTGDPDALAIGSLQGGAGGGAGANSKRVDFNYYFQGGQGGGGGGALGFEVNGTFAMGTSGRIEAKGGAGGFGYGIYSYYYYYYFYGYGGGGGGAAGGNVLVSAGTVDLGARTAGVAGAAVDTSGGAGNKSNPSGVLSGKTYNNDYLNDGGPGGVGMVRFEAVNYTRSFVSYANILGYTPNVATGGATTGGFTINAAYAPVQDTATTTWQVATPSGTPGLAPDYKGLVVPGGSSAIQGNVDIYIQGAHSSPITGNVDATNVSAQVLIATNSNLTNPGLLDRVAGSYLDPVDGYRYFRLIYKLKGPSFTNQVFPTVDGMQLNYNTQ